MIFPVLKNFSKLGLLCFGLISISSSTSPVAHASMKGDVPKSMTMTYEPVAQDEAEKKARALADTFSGFTGTCPQVSCGGTLCALICCPCCACCIAEAVLKECCSFPSTRVHRRKQAVREALHDWKKSLVGLEHNHGSVVNYNDYLGTIRTLHSDGRNETPLFDSDQDFASFQIHGEQRTE